MDARVYTYVYDAPDIRLSTTGEGDHGARFAKKEVWKEERGKRKGKEKERTKERNEKER